jgi:hypothetical protein
MRSLKVFTSKNPYPIPYERLWDTLMIDREMVLRDDLEFVSEGFLLIKQEFEIEGERLVRKALVVF